MTNISGTVDTKFSRLRDAFAANFSDGMEYGAAVSVVLDGKVVADLWGGHSDAARQHPWNKDTLVNVWSVTKGIVALSAAILVERGKLDYDRPIADYWPEFAQNGKARVTLGQAMSHQAGLDGLPVLMDGEGLCAWHPYVNALAEMAPLWEPGSRNVYHALTYGHLVSEPLRRVDGRSIGKFVQNEIAKVLSVPFYIGLPMAEDHRAAEMIEGPNASNWVRDVLNSAHPHACQNPTPDASSPNTRAFRAAEIPGGNGHTTALALAAIYGAMVQSKNPIISLNTLAAATAVRFDGLGEVYKEPVTWGAGFRLRDAAHGSPNSFGHGGWGGSLGCADPDARLGFGYVTNHMLGFDDGVDVRRQRLIEEVYAAL